MSDFMRNVSKVVFMVLLGVSAFGVAESLQDEMSALGPDMAIRQLPSPQQITSGSRGGIPGGMQGGNPNSFFTGGGGATPVYNPASQVMHYTPAYGNSSRSSYSYWYSYRYYYRWSTNTTYVRAVVPGPQCNYVTYACPQCYRRVVYLPVRRCRRPCGWSRCGRGVLY